jgi:hypothetical protein
MKESAAAHYIRLRKPPAVGYTTIMRNRAAASWPHGAHRSIAARLFALITAAKCCRSESPTHRCAGSGELDTPHGVGLAYLAITFVFCFARRRPFVVGGVLVTAAALLEGLQAFTADRTANLEVPLCSAGGALVATLTADLFIRAWRRHACVIRRKDMPTVCEAPNE